MKIEHGCRCTRTDTAENTIHFRCEIKHGFGRTSGLLFFKNSQWHFRCEIKHGFGRTIKLQGVSEKSVFFEICILSLRNVSKSDFIPKSSWNEVNRDFLCWKHCMGRPWPGFRPIFRPKNKKMCDWAQKHNFWLSKEKFWAVWAKKDLPRGQTESCQ